MRAECEPNAARARIRHTWSWQCLLDAPAAVRGHWPARSRDESGFSTSDTSPAAAQLRLPLFELSADEEPGVELSAPGLDDRNEERRWLEHVLSLAKPAESGESKIRALTRLLRRVREPAIVFTEYRDTLMRLASALHDLAPVVLHGGLTSGERREHLQAFRSGAARLLLATDAASEGLNLQQRCRLVINLELPWTPLRLEQRIGRVERIGQSRRVHAVHLLAAGTTEQSCMRTLLTRADRVAEALEHLRNPPARLRELRTTAEAETMRLEKLRALSSDGSSVPEERPPVTLLRKRPGKHDVWGFRLGFTNSVGQVVWHTLLGAAMSAHAATPPIDSIDAMGRLIAATLDRDREYELAALERSIHEHLDLTWRREQAIAADIEAERARLSASLLQRGLFDRRAERAFAAQEAVLDEALRRCRNRLEEIAATKPIAAEPRRLAFALIRR